eukprot:TRINITY_DN56393_c0_g1_i1.p1 TRINITY_DN56393_c0_g1~~TRINITY_DN56393_c0_g1_i1.p1  ORF type:complete len:277 (+),score=19.15 TRINITY_DN56393_c0_g1_i1:91-921(+)
MLRSLVGSEMCIRDRLYTWHMCGDTGTRIFGWLADTGEDASRWWAGLISFTLTIGIFHAYGLLQHCMDCTNGPWAARKIHRRDTLTYSDMLPNVLLNQAFVGLPTIMIQWYVDRGLRIDGGAPPSAAELFTELLLIYAMYEGLFYYSHLLLHHPRLYSWHKKHHSTFASVGISGHYSTPIDFFTMSAGPVLLAVLLFDTHAASVWLFAIVGSLNTIHSHGAYRLEGFPLPDAHETHHAQFHWNFGTGPLDLVHQTDHCQKKPAFWKRGLERGASAV